MRIYVLESNPVWINSLPEGLKKCGHEVLISGPLREATIELHLNNFQPDILLSMGWGSEQTPKKQQLAKKISVKYNVPLIYWSVEDPWHTESFTIPLLHRMQPDFVFTHSIKTVPYFKRLGFRAGYLDFGYDPSIFTPSAPVKKYKCRIAVVASAYPEAMLQNPDNYRIVSINTLIRPLVENNIRIDFWGESWDQMRKYFDLNIPNDWIHGYLPYYKTPKVYASADIVLGLQNYSEQVTQRTFEVLGSGGFLLTLDTPEVRRIFSPGRDLVVSPTPRKTLQLVNYYLSRSKERNVIQKNGCGSVLPYTYRNRAEYVIDRLREEEII